MLVMKQLLTINQEIQHHKGWLGQISGLKAEKMLRGYNIPYLYVLRMGEENNENLVNYYVTYIDFDNTIRHQPFTISTANEGWYYENYGGGGPYQNDTTIDHVLYLIMHCRPNECKPLNV